MQTIALTQQHYIYAQNDVILDPDSLDHRLAKMNKEWAENLSSARNYERLSRASILLQWISLAVCLAEFSDDVVNNGTPWCLGSIGIGLVSIPLEHAGQRKRHSVIEDYNHSLVKSSE